MESLVSSPSISSSFHDTIHDAHAVMDFFQSSVSRPLRKRNSADERTRAPAPFDLHLDKNLILKKVVYSPNMINDFCQLSIKTLGEYISEKKSLPSTSPILMVTHPPDIIDNVNRFPGQQPRRAAVEGCEIGRINCEKDVQRIYRATLASPCITVASTLVFQTPIWSPGFLKYEEKSEKTGQFAMGDAFLKPSDEFGSKDHDPFKLHKAPSLPPIYRDAKEVFPVWALWEFKNMSSGSPAVFKAILELAKCDFFPWKSCPCGDVNACIAKKPASRGKKSEKHQSGSPKKSEVKKNDKQPESSKAKNRYSTQAVPGRIFNVTWRPCGPDAPNPILANMNVRGEIPEIALETEPNDEDRCHAKWIIQQVWAEMVKEDVTFACLCSGRLKMYFARNRAEQCVYISDVVTTDTSDVDKELELPEVAKHMGKDSSEVDEPSTSDISMNADRPLTSDMDTEADIAVTGTSNAGSSSTLSMVASRPDISDVEKDQSNTLDEPTASPTEVSSEDPSAGGTNDPEDPKKTTWTYGVLTGFLIAACQDAVARYKALRACRPLTWTHQNPFEPVEYGNTNLTFEQSSSIFHQVKKIPSLLLSSSDPYVTASGSFVLDRPYRRISLDGPTAEDPSHLSAPAFHVVIDATAARAPFSSTRGTIKNSERVSCSVVVKTTSIVSSATTNQVESSQQQQQRNEYQAILRLHQAGVTCVPTPLGYFAHYPQDSMASHPTSGFVPSSLYEVAIYEDVGSTSLQDLLARDKSIKPEYATSAQRALDEIHSANYLLGNISLSNIIIRESIRPDGPLDLVQICFVNFTEATEIQFFSDEIKKKMAEEKERLKNLSIPRKSPKRSRTWRDADDSPDQQLARSLMDVSMGSMGNINRDIEERRSKGKGPRRMSLTRSVSDARNMHM